MFSFFRLWAITRKEWRHITRDPRIFFLVTLSPAFLLLILSYLFATDAGRATLVLLDEDRSAASRDYVGTITSGGAFSVRRTAANYAEAEADLAAGKADVVLAIPIGFGEALYTGRTARVQAIADASDSLAARTTLANLQARTVAYGIRLTGIASPVEVRTRVWFNEGLKSLWSMVPGLAAVVLCMPILAFTLAVKREEEVGTFEALVPSPVTGAEYQLGKLLAYVLSGLVSVALVVAVATLWFRVPLRGSLGLYLGLSAEFYLACMGISLLIARFAPSQQTAMFLVLVIFFIPGFFLAGLILPVNTASTSAMIISYSLPVTHFVAISRAVFLKGATAAQMRFPISMLGLMAAAGLGLSLLLFRKQVD